MATNVTERINVVERVPNIDYKYGPYTSVLQAYNALSLMHDITPVLTVGLTVGVIDSQSNTIKEYWFQGGINFENLVEKIKDIDWQNIQNKPTDLVQDANYVHTDNNFTTQEKTKLSGIESEAQVNIIEAVIVNGNIVEPTEHKEVEIKIPTATSQITNDSNFPVDANYVHTDNNFTTAEKTKLEGIAAGAEVNVQADWNQNSDQADDYIKNKPANLVQDASYVHTDNNFTTTEKTKLAGIAENANNYTLPQATDQVLGGVIVDTAMSNSSNNPVRNSVIAAAIANFITRNVNDLVNYYPKSQTYTKTEIANLIIESITTFRLVGPSSKRPEFIDDGKYAGYLYFDTDLGKYITWNGKEWVNMDGSPLTVSSVYYTVEEPVNEG